MHFMMNNLVCLGLIFSLVILTSFSLKVEIVKKKTNKQTILKSE